MSDKTFYGGLAIISSLLGTITMILLLRNEAVTQYSIDRHIILGVGVVFLSLGIYCYYKFLTI